ncbi:DNA-directed RNA polymerase subunit beta' [Entomospira nematocerorum]|uniref:DNA-directed RNA polymerase subunit beta' n=1 Tax=Entomospira nematocerorum TaxID=2719987 RepID=A0A968GC84_9SPIO|nr:DNA-directed RNA polymerase subunit beta' [Entomospira nematocera]NIZ47180.1 DNA-directed RNA polymerase subunit beta' [Entomospira nematocera]WDI34277.1 DNA-directed RNA polymerase subunit beta' [Entomospira nematocera]
MKELAEFDSITINLASPEQIRAWSYGEVKKPETINYRTLKPEKDGLFCERIFGTTKEWECFCGKFKSIRYKGVVCDRCGVEVTHFKVRRERIGHIELASPVSHIWYYRSVPSRMGLLLDLSMTALRSVLYFEKYIVVDAGDTDLKKMQLLSEEEYSNAKERFGLSFTAGIGAEVIRTLLEQIDLYELASQLRSEMIEKGPKSDKRLLKRLELVENFRDSGNRPEWMILDVVPVLPPELRPMVQLDGGRFATSDLNDLYRRVINRNNRLKRLISLKAPDIIIRNEKRMLQEAVDALFDNGKKKKAVKGSGNRQLKSLSDMLKGKSGRFRQNLLGKRVDYSGRSVIVVGPNLKLHQCGLPNKMAMELYKPFIMKKLVDREYVYNIKKAKILVEQEAPEVWNVLDEVVKEHPVLLNRAPTLHRLGMQAFEPVLVEGKAIRLHPLVCTAFNADFDGDQMAVHVPLTQAAQIECWTLMMSTNNLLNPANGQPVVYPRQDMILGIYYLTKNYIEKEDEKFRYFSSEDEVLMAAERGVIDYHQLCFVRRDAEWVKTTPGRIIFNQNMPVEVPFVNETLGDKQVRRLIAQVYAEHGSYTTIEMLDAIKSTGYRYATFFGASISMNDILIPEEKKSMVEAANKEIARISDQYKKGLIADEERYQRAIQTWSHANDQLTDLMMKKLEAAKGGFNNVFMMADSGARGSRNQIRQLAAMRGLMSKPNGRIIELPIRSNFKEGLSVIEYFISSNGARKGLSDTALKTAEAGYLTRRLVDIAQDVVVNEEDCGTINGLLLKAVKDGEEVIESLSDRLVGRFTLERVEHPVTRELIIDVGDEIHEEEARLIEGLGFESIKVRSVLSCEAKYGVCQKCYGRDLARGHLVNVGEAVGTIAAQSIGEPGTQLTMRTFHIGGAASTASEDNKISFKYDVYVGKINGSYIDLGDGKLLFTRRGTMNIRQILQTEHITKGDKVVGDLPRKVIKGEIIAEKANGEQILTDSLGYIEQHGKNLLLMSNERAVPIRNGAEVIVQEGQVVLAGEALASFDAFSDPIIVEQSGYLRFVEIELGRTLREETNEDTGATERKIADLSNEAAQPRIEVINDQGEVLRTYYLPGQAYLASETQDGAFVEAGTRIARMLKESQKAQDITSGLPRVSELFEARRPRNAAVLSLISGKVHFKGVVKGKRAIVVEDPFGKEFKHYVPMSRYLFVREGDEVEAGEPLCEGSIDPHDILQILGEQALQQFLLREAQAVYRMQGVQIHDKHIGIVIRQMMRKMEIVQIGDTSFIYGQQVDKYDFHQENARVYADGGEVAIARPLLLGVTRASLNIGSFISAASFQETTRVLTNAAIAGEVDNLKGLKENVIIGHLIPAGTGMKRYRNIKLSDAENNDLDEVVQQTKERRKMEQELARQRMNAELAADEVEVDSIEIEEVYTYEGDEGFGVSDSDTSDE